jgi:hypothetical protein
VILQINPPFGADEADQRAPKATSPARELWRAHTELPVRVAVPMGFSSKRRTVEDKAREIVGPLARGLLQMLKEDPQLPARKLLYGEMGYRGDWPQLMPPNWNPVLDRLGAGGAAGEEAALQQDGAQTQQVGGGGGDVGAGTVVS